MTTTNTAHYDNKTASNASAPWEENFEEYLRAGQYYRQRMNKAWEVLMDNDDTGSKTEAEFIRYRTEVIFRFLSDMTMANLDDDTIRIHTKAIGELFDLKFKSYFYKPWTKSYLEEHNMSESDYNTLCCKSRDPFYEHAKAIGSTFPKVVQTTLEFVRFEIDNDAMWDLYQVYMSRYGKAWENFVAADPDVPKTEEDFLQWKLNIILGLVEDLVTSKTNNRQLSLKKNAIDRALSFLYHKYFQSEEPCNSNSTSEVFDDLVKRFNRCDVKGPRSLQMVCYFRGKIEVTYLDCYTLIFYWSALRQPLRLIQN
jgi:hypothetical protein